MGTPGCRGGLEGFKRLSLVSGVPEGYEVLSLALPGSSHRWEQHEEWSILILQETVPFMAEVLSFASLGAAERIVAV